MSGVAFSWFLGLVALAAWLNHRWWRLPPAIGVMALSLGLSLIVLALGLAGINQVQALAGVVRGWDFDRLLLQGLLGFLLFAGALQVDVRCLRRQTGPVLWLATLGVILSAGIIAGLFWLGASWLGHPVSPLAALLFGILIAPTDAVAVGAAAKRAGGPSVWQTQLTGESLLNDGVAITLYLLGLAALTQGVPDLPGMTLLLGREVLGGILLGLVGGGLAIYLLRRLQVQEDTLAIQLTLGLVAVVYTVAQTSHVSGPLAVVTTGLVLVAGASDMPTRAPLRHFWEMLDEILNAGLFVLLGLLLVTLPWTVATLAVGAMAIPVALFGRFVSVALPIALVRRRRFVPRGSIRVLTWGGLRGGISVALALALPDMPEKELLQGAAYMVVVFSVLAQGLTVHRLFQANPAPQADLD